MNLRQDADLIIRSAIASALPDAAVQSALKDIQFDQEGRIILVALGLPLAVAMAWIFDFGPDGVHRTEDAPKTAADAGGGASGAR